VYFYSNQFGSRVYFDDLGPPWPKHPCTDNPRRQIVDQGTSNGSPTIRPKGLTQELIAAANTVGYFHCKALGVRAPSEWTLLVIKSIERHDNENRVRAEFLDSPDHDLTEFTCFSAEPIFEVGEYISKKGHEFSFLAKDTLIPSIFVAGGPVVSLPEKDTVPVKPPSPSHPPATRKPGSAPPDKRSKPQNKITPAEMKHFRSDAESVDQFCARLAPVVKTFAREGTRKPRDVAIRLNFGKHKTACGNRWTPHLVYLLLGFIFNDKGNTERSGRSNTARGDGARFKIVAKNGSGTDRPNEGSTAHAPNNSRAPLTAEEIAKRQAVLRRIARPQSSS
jgi:hypothetical protein